MKIKKYIHILFCLAAMMLLCISCSTTKDKWINRKYHQITAHYNAYWNGRESYKESIRTVNKSYKDDYTKILPIYKIPDKKTASTIKANTDRAIEKSSKVIKKHSMRFNNVEKNPEIDDAYLLIGRSCLLSGDFVGAEASFKYIIANWKHTNSIYEPMIYLALTYTRQRKYAESEIVIKEVDRAIKDKKAPKRLKDFMLLVWAENDLAQGKLLAANEKLQMRKKHFFRRSENTRLRFIQGQIYYQTKDFDKAYKSFGYAYRHAKDYNMQFAAKLNQALCFESGDEKSINIVEDLEKMLDKEVNYEFRDQIYYTIGEVYYKNRNLSIACKKWEESVKSSSSNTTQKIASAIRCADVYYNPLEDYKKAQMYYDTALTLMSRDHNDYKRISDRQKVLTNLVKNLTTVEKWDSLIAMSEMSKEELNAKIDKWITSYRLEQKKLEEKKRIEQMIAQRSAAAARQSNFSRRGTSSFYFYNPVSVQSGKLEFERIWGKRVLDDNWRISAKEEAEFEGDSMMNGQDGDSTQKLDSTALAQKNLTPDKRGYYTKDIPYSQGAKDTANAEIADALLSAGYIFWQGIGNKEKAVETFLDLHKRYPTHKHILPSSYHLYRIYDEMANYPSSNYYKEKILKEYPNSEFAAMVQNPQFWKKDKQHTDEQEKLYERTYNYYTNKEFISAIASADSAVKSIKVGEYIPKFQYIAALSKGKLYGADSLADNLNMIIYNYPNSDITPIIERQLQYLSSNYDIKDLIKYDKHREDSMRNATRDLTIADSIVKSIADSVYTKSVDRDDILDAESLQFRYKDGVHYYVMLADDSKFDAEYISEILRKIGDSSFSNYNLTIRANLFTSSYQIITVIKFPNMDEAFRFYDSVADDGVMSHLNANYYKHFIISIQNYATFYGKRNIDAYMKFFRIMYLNNKNE